VLVIHATCAFSRIVAAGYIVTFVSVLLMVLAPAKSLPVIRSKIVRCKRLFEYTVMDLRGNQKN